VAKAIPQYDLHDSGSESIRRRVCDRFHGGKSAHAAARNDVHFGSLKPYLLPSRVSVDMEHHHRCLNREVVDQLGRFGVGRVSKVAARAGAAHAIDIFIHSGPVKPKAHAMEGVVGVEMPANWVRVERNEQDVKELRWD
jgi:hypothetical protein